jgi:S1-C subfamily serine protease
MFSDKLALVRSLNLAGLVLCCFAEPALSAQRDAPTNYNQTRTTADIAAAAGPAVVTIVAFDSEGRKIGQGSGFVVRADGVVVTNWHVLDGASAATITLQSGAEYNRVMFLSGDQATDVALVKVPGFNLPTVQMTTSLPEVGTKIVTLGSPLGFANTVSEGIVSAIRVIDSRPMVQVTAPISHGSSGGAILDPLGRVFAISSRTVGTGQQINFGIPVVQVITLLGSPLAETPLSEAFTRVSSARAGSLLGSAALIRQKAEQGDGDAQEELAKAYYTGTGVSQDYTQAAQWFRRAADQGRRSAQFNLGLLYDLGLGVPRDVREGFAWIRKAAEQGLDVAQDRLALHYDLGRGVLQDDKQAVDWYRKASEQGHANAQLSLGLKYFLGKGVKRDKVESLKWISLAASRATDDTQRRSEKARDLAVQGMSRKQVAEAQKRAADWQAAFDRRGA